MVWHVCTGARELGLVWVAWIKVVEARRTFEVVGVLAVAHQPMPCGVKVNATAKIPRNATRICQWEVEQGAFLGPRCAEGTIHLERQRTEG